MTVRVALIVGLAGLSTACANSDPGTAPVVAAEAPEPEPEPISCRAATTSERAVFGAIVAHDEAAAANMMADTWYAGRIRAVDVEVRDRVFGQRIGDPSVRTVLMQPPLCMFDADAVGDERTTYVFARDRFDALQDDETEGVDLGALGVDYVACRYVRQEGRWLLADACLSSFEARPASVTPRPAGSR